MTEWCAEIGSNHNSSLDRAVAMLRAAADAGCGAVKVQQFRVETLFSPWALKNDPGLLHRKRWEFNPAWHETLSAEATRLHMRYGVTVFSRDREDFELAALFADYLKISSYQILDIEQIWLASAQKLPLVMSLGMATYADVTRAVLAAIQERASPRLTLLHCVSTYPLMSYEANLRSIQWLREQYPNCAVGWSDHSQSDLVVQRAAHFYKADHIEFHLDLDGDGWEYDGGHCWLPHEIAKVIKGPPSYTDDGYYAMDGKKTKAPAVSESEERMWRADPSDGLRPLMEIRK